MESATTARARLLARQQELHAELEHVQQQLDQLETKVLVSQWWQAPSGPKGRGTVYHSGAHQACLPASRPAHITLYEALRAGLGPCGRCNPKQA